MTQETSTQPASPGMNCLDAPDRCLVIHHSKEALGWNSEGSVVVPTDGYPSQNINRWRIILMQDWQQDCLELNLEQSLTLWHAVAAALGERVSCAH